MNLIFGLTVTGLLMLVTHWLPWPRRLRRLEAYIVGVASILIGQLAWLAPNWATWLALLAFAAVAGAATVLAYGLDWLLNLRIRAKHHDGNDAG